MIKLLLLLFLPFLGGHSKSTKSAVNTDLGISGWYTGYLKLYDSSKQYYERYNVQIKIYQKENIILGSALDLVMAGRCYAISELRGSIRDGKLYLQAQRFRKKKTDDFVDFILSDYSFPLSSLNNKFWYGSVFSFYESRQFAVGSPNDGIFLERKTNDMTIEALYKYKLPIVVDHLSGNALNQQYEQKSKVIDDIFSLKQRKGNKYSR